MRRRVYDVAIQCCRRLRKQQTAAETIVWNRVRNRQFYGFKFFRQHPVFVHDGRKEQFYIADFYCRELSLVIEVDGGSHHASREYDAVRTDIMSGIGLLVVRVNNEDVEYDVEGFLDRLATELRLTSRHH